MTDIKWLQLQRRIVELRIQTPPAPNYSAPNRFYYGQLVNAASLTNGAQHGLLNPAWTPGTEMIEIRAIRIPESNSGDLRAVGLNAIHTLVVYTNATGQQFYLRGATNNVGELELHGGLYSGDQVARLANGSFELAGEDSRIIASDFFTNSTYASEIVALERVTHTLKG